MNDIDSLPLAPPLHVAVVYQDAITQRWAAQLCARARVQCGDVGIRCADWRLDLMSDPEVFEEAVANGMDANLLVIAAYAHTNLPRDCKRLVQMCLARGRLHDGALVALLGKQPFARDSFPAKEYLAATAEASGVPYYLREFPLRTQLADLTLESIDERAHATTALLSDMLRRTQEERSFLYSPLHWSPLNES